MALLRLAPGIVSIKGKFAGQVFTKDSSGLHAVALPRHIKKTATAKQRDQRSWYASKKHTEKYPYPEEPYPDDDIPPGIHVVYSLETLWAHRQPSLTQPTYEKCEYAGFWPDQIWTWVKIYWNPSFGEWGLSKMLMFWMTIKWFYVFRSTWGMSSAVAFSMAKAKMLAWISTSAGAVAVPMLSLWMGLVALGFYFSFLEWLEGVGGSVSFTTGRVVIRAGKYFYWGGLVGRPSKKFYDFAVCGLAPFDGTIHKVISAPYPYKINFFFMQELWQSLDERLAWWYIYTWRTCRCRFRGKAYNLPGGRIRMQVSESQHKYWDKPIGWYQSNSAACAYLAQFHDHFEYGSHPAPPL